MILDVETLRDIQEIDQATEGLLDWLDESYFVVDALANGLPAIPGDAELVRVLAAVSLAKLKIRRQMSVEIAESMDS